MPQDDPTIEGALDVGEVTAAWSPSLPVAQATAIVSVLLYVATSNGDDVPPVGARLFEHDPDIDVSIADLGRLRGIIARRLAGHGDEVATSAAALRVHAALDDIVATVASRQLERLERTAMIDPLTGVGNRRAMDREVPAAVAHAARHGSRVAVAMMDLDGLKRINDTEGHAAGDDVLRTMGATLAANARAGDSVFRIGGDEFLIVARDSTQIDVEHLIERVRRTAPAFSAGIAALPEDGEDVATLLRVADARLYAGKGGRIVVVPSATATPTERPRRSHARRGRGVPLVLGAAVAAEGLRRQAGVDVRGADLVAWSAAATVTPVVIGAAGWRYRAGLWTTVGAAGTTLAGLLLLLPVLDDGRGAARPPAIAAPAPDVDIVEQPADDDVPRPVEADEGDEGGAPSSPDDGGGEPAAPIASVAPSFRGIVGAPAVTTGGNGPRVLPLTWPRAEVPEPVVDAETSAIPRIDQELGPTISIPSFKVGTSPRVLGPAASPQPSTSNANNGRGNPHAAGETGNPHEDGEHGDPHIVPIPGWSKHNR